MNAKRSKTGWTLLLGLLGGATLVALATGAAAAITGSLVAGTTCPGSSSAAFTPGGAAQTVTLCITSDANVCGSSIILKSPGAAEDDRFRVTARQLLGGVMTDPNTASITFPVSIVSTGTIDFGATTSSATSQPPATDLAIATFTIAPQASATNGSYVVSLLNSGITSTSTNCTDFANFADNAISASFTFFQPPTITIGAVPATLTDSAGQISTVTVTSSFAPPGNLVVNLTNAMPAGRATTACGPTITILPNQQTASCTVTATPNTVPFDGNVNASVTVASGGASYVVGVPSTANIAINDNDLPTVSIAALPASIFDSAGNVSTVTVTLSVAAPVGGFPVTITPPPTPNARYTTNCGSTLNILAGNTTAACTVTATLNATVGDGNVTAPVAIAASGTYNIIGTNPAVVTIQDDDIPVMSAVCTPTTLTDSAGQTSTCTITSDKALAAPLTVTLTPPAANARYTTTCVGTIDVPAGAAGTSNTCTISAVANTTIGDGNVTASLSVAAGAGYTPGGSTQNVAINNDDFASISVAVAPDSVAEDSGTPMVYTFTASAASTSATSILFAPPASSGRYSTTCVSPITLPATQTTVTCSVTPIGNGVLDGSATATVTVLPNAGVYTVGAPAVATGTITDNEIGIGVTTITQAFEGGSPGTFRVCRTGSTAAELVVAFTLGGNAVLGSDYSLFGNAGNTVVIPAGSACADLVVTAINNGVPNANRTVTLTLTPTQEVQLIPGQGSASMSIVDDDLPTTIPTLSTWGLILLSLLLAAAMGYTTRRRRI